MHNYSFFLFLTNIHPVKYHIHTVKLSVHTIPLIKLIYATSSDYFSNDFEKSIVNAKLVF